MKMVIDARNCAIREFTADGVSVGRCWYFVGDENRCPHHGDVTEAQKLYRETGKLTNDPTRSHPR